MTKRELTRRYCVFLAGLIFVSFGIAFITKASLGTSPLAAIPYSISLVLTQLTIGNWTILFSLLLIVLEIVMMRQETKRIEIVIQVFIAFAFGYLIDLALLVITAIEPHIYVYKILLLLTGSCILAFGAYLELVADVAMIPADAFVRALAKVTRGEYGRVRTMSDVSMAVIAAVLCLIFMHRLNGVREGTIIAALLVGNLIRFYSKKFRPLAERLVPQRSA